MNYVLKFFVRPSLSVILCVSPWFLLFTSCSDDESITRPQAAFTVSAAEVEVNQTVTFTYTGSDARQVVIFPGDEGHDYDNVNNGSTGLVMSKGIGTYAYKKAGVYRAVCVATNYGKEGKGDLFSIAETVVTVSDDDCRLRSVTLQKDLYNKELAATVTSDHVLIALPQKVNVNNRDIAVKANAQRIAIETMSAGATLLWNGEAFDDKAKYDLTAENVITVTAASGLQKSYPVYLIAYPAFEQYSIAGVKGTVSFSPYNYERSFVAVTLPKGTDLTQLTPDFVSADAQTIIAGGEPQTAGTSTLDFTSPVTYRLANRLEAHPEITCESEVIVSVTVK